MSHFLWLDPITVTTVCCLDPAPEVTCRGGQTTQKAKINLGICWTSQPEQVLTFFPYEISLRSELISPNISEDLGTPAPTSSTSPRSFALLGVPVLYCCVGSSEFFKALPRPNKNTTDSITIVIMNTTDTALIIQILYCC